MQNKMVRKQHSACRRLINLLDPRQAVDLARRLVTNLAEAPPPVPEALTLAEVLTLLGLRLETERRRLADAAMQQQLLEHDLGALRRIRDIAAGQLQRKLSGIRQVVVTVFGQAGIDQLLGGMSRVPRDPPTLAALGKIVLRRFRQDPIDLPESRMPNVSLEPLTIAAGIEPPLVTLEGALDGLRTVEARHRSTVSAKNDALALSGALLRPTERLLGALRQLADAPLS